MHYTTNCAIVSCTIKNKQCLVVVIVWSKFWYYTVSENKPVDVKSLFDTIIIISLKRKVVVVIYCTRLHLKGFYTYLGSLM